MKLEDEMGCVSWKRGDDGELHGLFDWVISFVEMRVELKLDESQKGEVSIHMCYFFPWLVKGLDFVISEARRYGIRLILSLVNNYENFGGNKQYAQWARNQGQYLASDDDFFRNSLAQGYYKNHVKVTGCLDIWMFALED
ncbi:mannan endo-1,4-beta-mannosidase 7-like protein [Cinnamomum micranthum f. kanehirae]|uniref:Mannan endo-1,4-beta-mannosidase 7-like protein n=1 Tax=Cinnamomum micranthum f. kanehirae TaxID=337451 RepID=A0A3S3MVZ8_9MAGN|nr:mannan endo-1,4-beta-mannosidase 7-like protein [Cinnamomum micranthum f. kanehirae]